MSNSNNKYKTLVSNTMLISLGTFGSKLLVFFMVRFYTSCLTPADYGTADLITQTAWRAPCCSWPFCRCWGSSRSLTGSSG